MWPFNTLDKRERHASCSKALELLQERVERVEEKLELDRMVFLNTLEKVTNKLMGRIRKRQDEDDKDEAAPAAPVRPALHRNLRGF